MKITIMRHGKPANISDKKINAKDFRQWIEQYDQSHLDDASKPSDAAIKHANECKLIVSSELNRSQESAKKIKGSQPHKADMLFREAGMPNANWRYPLVSPTILLVIFRLAWLLGYSKNSESFKETKLRASKTADLFEEYALNHEHILFVGHGVFNRLVIKDLLSKGWKGAKSASSEYWGYNTYEK